MKREISNFIEQYNLCTKEDKILVAVSGGVDSMVLATFLHVSGYRIGVAHCNFGLRGKESDTDEAHVRELAKRMEVPFYSKCFETERYAAECGISIQMAARALRYEWFEELMSEHKFSKLAVAHHVGDQIETVLLNLTRGTGIKGLTGMDPIRDKIIRPLLNVTKEEIIAYARAQGIDWREDASNASNKYKRNSIRNEVIPLLKKQNEDLEHRFLESTTRLKEVRKIYEHYVQESVESVLDGNKIDISRLQVCVSPISVLWTIVEPLNFSYSTASDMIEALSGPSGKWFESQSHRILKDRNSLLIASKKKNEQTDDESVVYLNVEEGLVQTCQTGLGVMELSVVSEADPTLLKLPGYAFLDFEKLSFPLQLRIWKNGDRFRPYGQSRFQKLSDFLVNNKVSRFEKEKVCVLLSEGTIVWVPQFRIDHAFAIGPDTNKILKLKYRPND